jgi:hypothetical protein
VAPLNVQWLNLQYRCIELKKKNIQNSRFFFIVLYIFAVKLNWKNIFNFLNMHINYNCDNLLFSAQCHKWRMNSVHSTRWIYEHSYSEFKNRSYIWYLDVLHKIQNYQLFFLTYNHSLSPEIKVRCPALTSKNTEIIYLVHQNKVK